MASSTVRCSEVPDPGMRAGCAPKRDNAENGVAQVFLLAPSLSRPPATEAGQARAAHVRSPPQVCDPELVPHPAHVIAGHWRVCLLSYGRILDKLEPADQFFAALLCFRGLARAHISQHRHGLVEKPAVVAFEGFVDDCALFVRREAR